MKKYIAIMAENCVHPTKDEQDRLNTFMTNKLLDPSCVVILAPPGVASILEIDVPDKDVTSAPVAPAWWPSVGDIAIVTCKNACYAGFIGEVVGIDENGKVKLSKNDFNSYVARIDAAHLRRLPRE